MHKRTFAAALLTTLFLTTPALPDTPATAPAAPATAPAHDLWSAADNGVRARLTIEPNRIFNGTLLLTTRLELDNVQNVGNPLPFAWSRAKLTYRVEDPVGKELPRYSGPFDGMSPNGGDLVLPFKARLSFPIISQGTGVPADALAILELSAGNCWILPRDGKTYRLQATLEIPQVGHDPPWFGWYGKLDLPAVEIPTRPPALDPAQAAATIETLGAQMLAGPDRDEARRRLSLIDDERVIPWYVRALKTSDYELKFEALDRLARFRADAALEGLKLGMTTSGRDMGNTSNPQVAQDIAVNIRHEAAIALARSPHPDAKKLLLTMAGDPAMTVRLTIVQTAQHMDDPRSLEILTALTHDADATVRGEAERCLKARTDK